MQIKTSRRRHMQCLINLCRERNCLWGKKAKEVKMRENKIYHFIIVGKELLQLAELIN